jgi:hypothetical protein
MIDFGDGREERMDALEFENDLRAARMRKAADLPRNCYQCNGARVTLLPDAVVTHELDDSVKPPEWIETSRETFVDDDDELHRMLAFQASMGYELRRFEDLTIDGDFADEYFGNRRQRIADARRAAQPGGLVQLSPFPTLPQEFI